MASYGVIGGTLAVLGLPVALGAAPPAGMPPQSPRTLVQGSQSAAVSAKRLVVTDPNSWSRVWKTEIQTAGDAGGGPPPKVDFSREMVLAVFQGQKSTGGYSVTIVSAQPQKEALVVTVREQVPPPNALTIQVLTAPYHAVAVPRSNLPVQWKVVPAGKTLPRLPNRKPR